MTLFINVTVNYNVWIWHRAGAASSSFSALTEAAEGSISSQERPLNKMRKPTHWARDVGAYDILGPIGEGTYGKVLPFCLPFIAGAAGDLGAVCIPHTIHIYRFHKANRL